MSRGNTILKSDNTDVVTSLNVSEILSKISIVLFIININTYYFFN